MICKDDISNIKADIEESIINLSLKEKKRI